MLMELLPMAAGPVAPIGDGPFIEAEGWRPTLLTERSDLGAWLKPRKEQLELFG